jgi:homoserine O-succinyltransferase/O-acetyltransferase
MPLMIGKRPVLDDSRDEKNWRPLKSSDARPERTACVDIALVNNMPDSALADTESQFADLLATASGDIPVRLKFYSLPSVARSARVHERLRNYYFSIEDLWNSRFDGVIITGTEPRQADLRQEPYWSDLTDLLDWAERNTASAVLSCLAAHASVLYSDGIERHALSDKRFGTFSEQKVADHLLMHGAGDTMQFPHSRWNELREDALTSVGYAVLTKSAEAGVNLFVKKKRESLFVHFQGHPEYGTRTLLKEYRRDVGRFLRQERGTYPSLPREYFDVASSELLIQFQENAMRNPRKELLAEFPETVVARALQKPWHAPAVCIYRNWLQYVTSKRRDVSALVHASRVGLG